MSIQHLLSRPVSALPAGASCVEAARRMRRERVGSIVIEEHGSPIGMVTDRDLALRIVADERDPATVSVGSIMSRFPAFLNVHRSLEEALDVMREMRVRRLPAVDSHGRVVGMLSLDDILTSLSGQLARVRRLLDAEATEETLPE